jgi:hypothetical protein
MSYPKVTNIVVLTDSADTLVYAPNHNGIIFSNKSNAVNGVRV